MSCERVVGVSVDWGWPVVALQSCVFLLFLALVKLNDAIPTWDALAG